MTNFNGSFDVFFCIFWNLICFISQNMSEEYSGPESGEKETLDQDANIDVDMSVDEIDAEIDEDFLIGEGVGELGDQLHEEILLSSDEEPDITEEVSLVLLKRPPAIAPQEAVDILDSDEEFPVFLAEASKPENVNILEKKGRVAEFIEKDGLGMIFAE